MSSLKSIKLELIGTSGLLMHSDRLANPLDDLTKELKKVSKKRTKTDDDHAEMAKIEFFGSLYFDDNVGVYLPSNMIKAAIVSGAKKLKKGTHAKSAIFIKDSMQPIQHSYGKTIKELWENPNCRLTCAVVVNRARIMRTRPLLKEWSCVVHIEYDSTVLDHDEILNFVELAGKFCGVGAWRVALGGEYGRFDVREVA